MVTSLDITLDRVDSLVRLLTDSLVTLKDETGTATVTNGKVINQKEWAAWDWNQGVALAVLSNFASSRTSPASKHAQGTIQAWFDYQNAATDGAGAPKNINTMAPLYALASCVSDGRMKGEPWEAWVDEWAEWAMDPEGLARTQEGGFQHITYRKENKDQLWADTLFMTVVPLARIGILRGQPAYLAEAKYQVLLHMRRLEDCTTGLWFHGWEYTPNNASGVVGHNFARARWGRGNCWITYALPLLLDIMALDDADPVRRTIVAAYRRQVDALVRLQDRSGLWHTLLDDPGSYLEVSASAGFAAGILMGIRTNLLDRTYLPTAERALAAVIANIQPDGTVVNVSYGTPILDTLDLYREIPLIPMPYGQGLAMAALVEWSRLQGTEPAVQS